MRWLLVLIPCAALAAPGDWRPAETQALCIQPPIPAAMQASCASVVAAQATYDPTPPPLPPPAGSALAAAAAALAPGEFAPIAMGGLDASLWRVGGDNLLAFANTAVYDAGAVHFCTQDHSSTVLAYVRYDEAADQWVRTDGDWQDDTAVWAGHGYDHTAAADGRVWCLESGGQARELVGGLWQPFGTGAIETVAGIVEATPVGLFVAGPYVQWLADAPTGPGFATLATHAAGAYSSRSQRVYYGGGNGARTLWSSALDGSWRVEPDAPAVYGSSDDQCALVEHPSPDYDLLLRCPNGAAWRFDGAAWSAIAGAPGHSGYGLTVSVPALGVVLVVGDTATIWRP